MTIKESKVKALFLRRRFDDCLHVGLGDIRLSIGEQEIMIAEIMDIINDEESDPQDPPATPQAS